MKKMRGFMQNMEKWDFNFKNIASVQLSHKPNLEQYKNSYLAQEWTYLQKEYGYSKLIQRGDVRYAIK
ncbi:TPA: hypothetical protein LWH11_000723 [Listeria innocua]|nr:hypothetical protein [Listeria innocua]EAD5765512.1 hypothetical protein [Listeria innocua]EAE2434809.1 hypothetical protein [Listeria innocua]EAG8533839.1 hypothetical protein [Listeria innocua]ECJ9436859.1 hypothetical protein [Listeria innocua]ECL7818264.1 hypothetical protein [Listeria innocua]